jgi:hypothetical protein
MSKFQYPESTVKLTLTEGALAVLFFNYVELYRRRK